MQNAMYASSHCLIHHVSPQVTGLNTCVFLIRHWRGDVYQAIAHDVFGCVDLHLCYISLTETRVVHTALYVRTGIGVTGISLTDNFKLHIDSAVHSMKFNDVLYAIQRFLKLHIDSAVLYEIQ